MGQEHLTVSKWNNVKKKNDVKDTTVEKALKAFDEAEKKKDDYDSQLDALKKIEDVADKLKRSSKDKKDVTKFLEAMVSEAQKRKKNVETLKKANDKKTEEEDDDGDVRKLLGRVRNNGTKRVLQFMICKKGDKKGVVLAKRITQKHRTELKKKVGDGGQFARGDCAFEDGKFAFIMKKAVSGMARTIKKALAVETGKADWKVRVRDDETTNIIDDENDTEEADFAVLPDTVDDLPEDDDNDPQSTTTQDPAEAKIMTRLQTIAPQYLKAVGSGTGNVTQMETLYVSARGSIQNKDFSHADRLLTELEELLKAPETSSDSTTPTLTAPQAPSLTDVAAQAALKASLMARIKDLTPEYQTAIGDNGPQTGEMKTLLEATEKALKSSKLEDASKTLGRLEDMVSKVVTEIAERKLTNQSEGKELSSTVLEQASQVWDGTRKQVRKQIVELERTIIQECERLNDDDDAEFEVDLAEVRSKTTQLYAILDKLDEGLINTLKEAIGAKEPQVRKNKQKEAIGIIKKYLGVVKEDKWLGKIDNNGFTESNIRNSFVKALSSLASKL
ncbi:MAG: hypothetical protein ACFCD0_27900 [Gemmataceae bacterium]